MLSINRKIHECFREHLEFQYAIKLNRYSMADILDHHIEIALQIEKEVKPLKYFAHVLKAIHKDSNGIGLLQKPDKLFLENTNYAYALSQQPPNVCSLRETFFLNQLSALYAVNVSVKGDFLVDHQYIFEIGGKSKDFTQIADVQNSYMAADQIEFGVGNKIPLWLFGFLY